MRIHTLFNLSWFIRVFVKLNTLITVISISRQMGRICARSSFDNIYLKLCHWETWRPPQELQTLLLPTHKVQLRSARAWTARLFSTVWFWSILSVTRGPWRAWTPPWWGGCPCLRKATSRRWSRGEWRAAPSSLCWPVWEVNGDIESVTNITRVWCFCACLAARAEYFVC